MDPDYTRAVKVGIETLLQPFVHTEAFNPANGLPDPTVEADYDSTEAYEAVEDAYWARREDAVFRPEHSIGLLYLCHPGCAYRETLVIRGPARGQRWADDPTTDAGFRPLADDDGTPLGFTRWYRRWLDNSEAQLSRNRYFPVCTPPSRRTSLPRPSRLR